MIRKVLFTGVGLALLVGVVMGTNAKSYVKTGYHRLTNSVNETVPVEFQIDRAKQMVVDLEPEIRNSMHVIAKEEVAVEQLNKQIDGSQTQADKEKGEIMRLQADLGQNKNVYRYA